MIGLPNMLAVSPLLLTVAVVAMAIVVVPAVYVIVIYNGLKRAQVRAQNAFSQIDVQLKRRFDLIPNLVETVKGSMAHERGTLEAVIAARAQAAGALGAVHGGAFGIASVGALANASGALDGALNRLMGLVERYPELKANQNALQLQEELASTENRIAFARQAYNDAVMRLNESIVVFPASFVAGFFGIEQMGMFEAAADERAVVGVKF
jgi:LemA protein